VCVCVCVCKDVFISNLLHICWLTHILLILRHVLAIILAILREIGDTKKHLMLKNIVINCAW